MFPSRFSLVSAGAAICSVFMLFFAAFPALSHSLKELDQQLYNKEKYFQPMDLEAPDFTLYDADGRMHRLSDLRGEVVVLNFVYTSCPDVCPLHAERIAEVQKLVNLTPMKSQVVFVTITTDPARDSGDVIQSYGGAHGLDSVNWVFLTTGASQPGDTTREIAKAYGIEFDEAEDGLQMHGIVTHVIDQDGRFRARFHGLNFEPVNLLLYINGLINKAQAPHGHDEQSLWQKMKGMFAQ